MKKNILPMILIALLLMATLAGCGSAGQTPPAQEKLPEKIVIQAPPAPPTAPILKMIESKPFGDKVAIEFIQYKTVEEATARVIKGEVDFTVLPVNTAAKLYNKNVDISLANVTTWGILYLLSSDPAVTGWQQLKGKEVYVGAQGASPDIITRYLLDKNQISISDLNVKYANSPEIAQMMIQGLAKTAVLPEPQVTQVLSKNKSVKLILDYQKEWQLAEKTDAGLPQAGMVVQNAFVKNYPIALATLQESYRAALEQTVANPASVSALVKEKFSLPAPVFEASMTRTNLKFAAAADARTDVDNYLSKLLQFSPDMVGGKLPDEKFYLAK